jgi:hypothetical protein
VYKVGSLTSKQADKLAAAVEEICKILVPIPRWLRPVVIRGVLEGLAPDDAIDNQEELTDGH